MQLSGVVKLIKIADHSTAATSDVTSAIVDTAGYAGVLFITSFGTAAANNTLKAQQDTDVAGATMADLLGTSVASGTSDEDVWIDIYRPLERYVRVVAAGARAHARVDLGHPPTARRSSPWTTPRAHDRREAHVSRRGDRVVTIG